LQPFDQTFRESLADHGYSENQNIVIEWRFGAGTQERMTELAAELARLPVDVIVAGHRKLKPPGR
jgi:hypothetical protein